MSETASVRREDAVPSIGAIIAQKYRVESVVGVGGMGIVVAARHLQLGQTVAIKLLSVPDEDYRAEASSRFMREAQAAAALRNDHVVKIYDVGSLESGLPFMVMELLQGSDLGALIDAEGAFPVAMAVDYLLQACAAISEAHAAGIVHRDLKPSNLFVTRRTDGTPLVKVLDFGISKSLVKSEADHGVVTLTSTRSVMGSPYYMSPEQVRDARKVDGRSDIWSLGVILHELLTGEPAFQGETFPGVCAAIVADPPRSLRSARPDVPEELERVVLTCLEKDVTRRFQSVTELIIALLPFSSDALTGSVKRWRAISESDARPAQSESATMLVASSARVGFDETIASPRAQPSARTPSGDTKTQLSADLVQAAITPKPATSPRRTWVLVAAGALLLVGGGITAAALQRDATADRAPPPKEVSAPVPAVARPNTLTIDSTPAGAEVYEGLARLGETPVTLSYPAEDTKARSFVLRRKGYQNHPLEQAPAQGDVRVHAVLVAEPQAVSSAEIKPASTAPKPARAAARPPAPRSKPSAPAAPPADIRLQR